jgi:hypothetical protein
MFGIFKKSEDSLFKKFVVKFHNESEKVITALKNLPKNINKKENLIDYLLSKNVEASDFSFKENHPIYISFVEHFYEFEGGRKQYLTASISPIDDKDVKTGDWSLFKSSKNLKYLWADSYYFNCVAICWRGLKPNITELNFYTWDSNRGKNAVKLYLELKNMGTYEVNKNDLKELKNLNLIN